MLREKLADWLRRYWLAQVLSFAAALVAGPLAFAFSANLLASAFLTTWATNLVFYGTIAWQEVNRQHQHHVFGPLAFLKALRNLLLEFGPGEYLDSFVLRPFWLAALPLVVKDYMIAIALGTLLADVSFFLPVIFSSEARKKYLGE